MTWKTTKNPEPVEREWDLYVGVANAMSVNWAREKYDGGSKPDSEDILLFLKGEGVYFRQNVFKGLLKEFETFAAMNTQSNLSRDLEAAMEENARLKSELNAANRKYDDLRIDYFSVGNRGGCH